MTTLQPRISAKNVNFFYGQFQALRDVNLEFQTNQITALIGPSGCGKSTFLRCINRMNDLIEGARMEGEITLDGEDVYNKDIDVPTLRRKVGMVFQRPNPFAISIYKNIAYGPIIHNLCSKKEIEERVVTSLLQAYLWDEVKDKLNQSALSLSGGQQQRLCIARVLAVKPEVILMDEPCSALDPVATFRIEELIEELRVQYTIVIVTHNMQQASRISQNTGFFLKGQLLEFGQTDDIFTTPKQKMTEDYIMGRFG